MRQWIDAYGRALEERLERFGELLDEETAQVATSVGKRDGERRRKKREASTKERSQ